MKKRIISLCAITTIMALVILAGCDKFMKIVTVKTGIFSNLGSTSVTLKGELVSTGGNDEVEERGFYYSINKNLKPALTAECGPGKKGAYEVDIKGLKPSTKYYYAAYARSEDDIDRGDVQEFTTFDIKLTVTTEQPEIIGNGEVTLKGSYDNKEKINIEKVGFEYAKNANFKNADTVYASSPQTPFTVTKELDQAIYYCRAFVIAEESTILLYGDRIDFSSVPPPNVTTEDATEIDSISAVLNASYTGNVDNRGFFWWSDSDTTKHDEFVGSGTGNGTFFKKISELTNSTTYYYKAYVTYYNGAKKVIGEQKSFTTTRSNK